MIQETPQNLKVPKSSVIMSKAQIPFNLKEKPILLAKRSRHKTRTVGYFITWSLLARSFLSLFASADISST